MEMNEMYFWFQLTNTKIINLGCLPKNGRSKKIQNVTILLILAMIALSDLRDWCIPYAWR